MRLGFVERRLETAGVDRSELRGGGRGYRLLCVTMTRSRVNANRACH